MPKNDFYYVGRIKNGVTQYANGYDEKLGYVTGWSKPFSYAIPIPAAHMDRVVSHLTPEKPDPNLGEIFVQDSNGRNVTLTGSSSRVVFAPPPPGLTGSHVELYKLLGMTGDPATITLEAVAATALQEIKDLRELMHGVDGGEGGEGEGNPTTGPGSGT